MGQAAAAFLVLMLFLVVLLVATNPGRAILNRLRVTLSFLQREGDKSQPVPPLTPDKQGVPLREAILVSAIGSALATAVLMLVLGFFPAPSDRADSVPASAAPGSNDPPASVTPSGSVPTSHGRADWQYQFVEGVGDTDGNGVREVLVVEEDGTGTLFELSANDALVNPLPTFHDWTPYELITGVGNVDSDPTPEIFVEDGEDGWLLGRTSSCSAQARCLHG